MPSKIIGDFVLLFLKRTRLAIYILDIRMKCQALFLPKEKKIRISSALVVTDTLTFTTIWVKSVDDKLEIFFLIFLRKQHLTFYANVSFA